MPNKYTKCRHEILLKCLIGRKNKNKLITENPIIKEYFGMIS